MKSAAGVYLMVPSRLTVALPWSGAVSMVTVSVWALSFDGPATSPLSTSIESLAVSSAVVVESASATGESLTSVTVIDTVAGALRPLSESLARYVNESLPLKSASGV